MDLNGAPQIDSEIGPLGLVAHWTKYQVFINKKLIKI